MAVEIFNGTASAHKIDRVCDVYSALRQHLLLPIQLQLLDELLIARIGEDNLVVHEGWTRGDLLEQRR